MPFAFPFRVPLVIAAITMATRLIAQQSHPVPSALHRISLDDAIRIAQLESQSVGVARAGLTRSTGERLQSHSQALPQVGGNAGYTRTLASQFQGVTFGSAPDSAQLATPALCSPSIPNTATVAQRNAAIAQAATCPASSGGGFSLSSVGFGAANEWSLGLQVSQNLYTGGRIQAQDQAATAQERSAGIEVSAQRAQAALDVAQAYYDAALADKLVMIADSSLMQTEEVLRLAKLGREVGEQSEFDLLKAQVTRDNQVPVLIQARANRQIAYLRLKQQLNFSLDDSLVLSTMLDEAPATGTSSQVAGVQAAASPIDTALGDRAPVRELEEAIRADEALTRVAHSERLPSLALVSSYQRLFFPSGLFPDLNAAKQNWTIGVSSNVSLFTGGHFQGDALVAAANLEETEQRLKQTRQLAALDSRLALNQLEQADASWRASQGTVEEAQKAYGIDEIRFREGISTQTDLSQSRLLLQQSMANRAQAARDLAVARIRLSLLRDLPIQGGGASGSGASGGGQSTQAQPSSNQSTQSAPGASQTGVGTGGQNGGLFQ